MDTTSYVLLRHYYHAPADYDHHGYNRLYDRIVLPKYAPQ